MFEDVRVLIKGAGDLATGVAARLWRSGFPVVMTELAEPLTIRRTVALAEAVYTGEVTVEEITARCVNDFAEIKPTWRENVIPILVGCDEACVAAVKPEVLVDAILAKRNVGTRITDAPFVIGLGPGFTAGHDVHARMEHRHVARRAGTAARPGLPLGVLLSPMGPGNGAQRLRARADRYR